ncbi:MAG TPA: DJ-1/PfpI family protein [Lacunisphaera sp.]|jgi:transcriptional regulator GlxA family with amidase domain|nr:DJ-1/PfpI family protein [Lacunisphaera sp.]
MRRLLLPTLGLLCAATLAAAEPRLVAVLVWPGVELLDFTGPCEVFSAAGHHQLFRVFLVGLDGTPVRTQNGVTVQPEFTLANCPRPDVVVVPGGDMRAVEGNAPVLAWVKARSGEADVTLSVCTGAFVLAEAGLLDGLPATTHHRGWDELARDFPQVRVVRTARFVDNGRIITAGGVSAGIDGALRVVEKLAGAPAAEWAAREWMEYRGYPSDEPAGAPGSRTAAGR